MRTERKTTSARKGHLAGGIATWASPTHAGMKAFLDYKGRGYDDARRNVFDIIESWAPLDLKN